MAMVDGTKPAVTTVRMVLRMMKPDDLRRLALELGIYETKPRAIRRAIRKHCRRNRIGRHELARDHPILYKYVPEIVDPI